jgi:hypothetical protein
LTALPAFVLKARLAAKVGAFVAFNTLGQLDPTCNRGTALACAPVAGDAAMSLRTALLALSGAAALLAAASIGVPSSFDAMDEVVAFALRAGN